MNIFEILTTFFFSLYFNALSNLEDSSGYLRRSLLAYPESGSNYKTTVNPWATMSPNNKIRLVKDFKFRVEQDGIKFFESQRLRTDSAINHNTLVPGIQDIQPMSTNKEDPTIPIDPVYLPKVTRSSTCYDKGTGYTCVPNKNVWTSNPGNFAFLYYNSMEECEAKDGQPFYFYSEFQTSCTAGIRQSANKYSKTITVKSYDNLDCTGKVKTKYSYPISATSYPSLADYNKCHDSPYSAGIVKVVLV